MSILRECGTALKNWEADVQDVRLEPCSKTIDPLGFQAVFVLTEGARRAVKLFAVGVSHLGPREKRLIEAGYKAPMTRRAIALYAAEVAALRAVAA